MKQYLFIFSIGPVQSFIAQARKTQDLYAGSQLLSDLIRFAIKNQIGKDNIIYPYPDNDSLTNRLVAKISAENDSHLTKKISQIKENVDTHFFEIAKKHLSVYSNWREAQEQLNDFLDIFWAAVPFDAEYQVCYKKLEQQFAATKNYRPFKQLCEQGRKCNVTGQYNAIYYRKNFNENQSDAVLKKKKFLTDNCLIINYNDDKTIKYRELQVGEGVCAITMLKRKYERSAFASTADVAMLNALRQVINKQGIEDDLTCFATLLGESTPYTIGQFWFEENINENYFAMQGKLGGFNEVKRYWLRINDHFKENKIKPQKYYAVLTFDADNMGTTIGGLSEEKQKRLSECLGTFASKTTKFIDDNGYGYTVYAGGDDYLGFLTLPTAFEVLQKLRLKFDEEVGNEFSLKMSAGLAISHYKTPLSETLSWSKRMEHEAKDMQDKNAIGIAAVKHSGEIIKSVLKWQTPDNVNIMALLKGIYDNLSDNFSAKFIHIIGEEFRIWEGDIITGKKKTQLNQEISRLLDRACMEQSNKPKKQLLINDFKEKINKLSSSTDSKTVEELVQILSIIDFSMRKLEI
jgi:CRISPR-associated protein Cmr2